MGQSRGLYVSILQEGVSALEKEDWARVDAVISAFPHRKESGGRGLGPFVDLLWEQVAGRLPDDFFMYLMESLQFDEHERGERGVADSETQARWTREQEVLFIREMVKKTP